jgi:hypothetical protein
VRELAAAACRTGSAEAMGGEPPPHPPQGIRRDEVEAGTVCRQGTCSFIPMRPHAPHRCGPMRPRANASPMRPHDAAPRRQPHATCDPTCDPLDSDPPLDSNPSPFCAARGDQVLF